MSTITRIRRAVFARHANPWSAWTRWATTPLILVPVWQRSWRNAGWISLWFALNPVLFPAPADQAAWSTRAPPDAGGSGRRRSRQQWRWR